MRCAEIVKVKLIFTDTVIEMDGYYIQPSRSKKDHHWVGCQFHPTDMVPTEDAVWGYRVPTDCITQIPQP